MSGYGFPEIPGYEWDVRVTQNNRFYLMLHRAGPRRGYTSAVAVELESFGWKVTVNDTGGMPYSTGLGPTLRAAIADSERVRPSGMFAGVSAQ